ncbi:MAG: hypothetical protein HKP27_08965 [Myxococcales bacterium]|nr:hypothetical protein [Myxococcales bacterium]
MFEFVDTVEFGGDVYMPVGFTSGGAPFGPTLEDLRRIEEEASRRPWARAKRAIRAAFRGAHVDFYNRITKLGDGLSSESFGAEVRVDRRLIQLVVQLPKRDAPESAFRSKRNEFRVLTRLTGVDLPFRVPRPIAMLPANDG